MTDKRNSRVAVVGISAILPGGENINECWEMIRDGIDNLADLPEDRVDVTAYYNPKKGVKDKIYCKRGGFIPDFDFDAREFGMNMFQVEDSDANQTLTLLKVKEALEDGGVKPFTKEKKNIGVVLGIGGGQKSSNEFYSRLNYTVVEKVLKKIGLPDEAIANAVEKYKSNFPEWRLDSFPGMLGNVTAGRCTNVFNLQGMNCVVDAACASSLIALKVAIDELVHGDCDEMVCGATCTDNALGMFMAFSKTPVFSTDQSLTAYDENTKGMLIGEGSVMLLLKRYDDAVRDGNTIHAVIEGVASSSDGKASGIYSPTVTGQELAIQRAYAKAGISPADVSLVEGHGTGTPVGDRIELTGLKNVFRPYFNSNEQIAVGSIKSQIGHLKACAGMAGLVKVIMGLKHKVLPGSINVKNPPLLFDNTRIQDSPLYVNTQMRPWFTNNGKKRIAGVSSFGFGGANYHCVVSEAESEHTEPYRMHSLPQPVVLTAANDKSLLSIVSVELKKLESETTFKLLEEFRTRYTIRPLVESNARVGFLSKDITQTIECLQAIKEKLSVGKNSKEWTILRQGCLFRPKALAVQGKTAALFSGQGAQYLNMFSDVAMNWPTFREAISKMDRVSEKVCNVRTSSILYPRSRYENEEKLNDAEISSVQNAQICTVACSIGSYHIFKKAGFNPDFAAGHSLGEFAALYASGAIGNEEDLYEIIANRGKIMSTITSGKGAMLAVIGPGASKVKVSTPNVFVGNSNSPDQVVLTGEDTAIDKEAAVLKKKFKCVKLNVSDAFHSEYMKEANQEFLSKIQSFTIGSPKKTKVFSNVSTVQYSSNVMENLNKHMTSTVEFEKQVLNMYDAGARVFIEFGPRNTLIKLVENILKGKQDFFTAAVNNTSRIDSETQIRECALKMCIAGVELNNFDPWGVPNRFKLKATERKKTTLRLSAATYVSKKTLKAREAIMEDGYRISANTSGNQVHDTNKLRNQLEVAKKTNEDLKRQLQLVTGDVERLQQHIERIENQSSANTVSNDFVEINTLKKHRELIVGMLGEYDRMMDTLTQADHRDFSSVTVTAPIIPVSSSPVDIDKANQSPGLLKKAADTVLQVLAEKTGYEVEMIEPDMELETELGIDSIKRVEILSEVQTMLHVEVSDVDALSRTRTVGDVINAMKMELAGTDPENRVAPTAQEVAKVEAATGIAVNQALLNKAEQAVMSVLAEKTGYEVEMIENDMELETELGIDSIKRVEILSEVQSMLSIEARDVDALSRTRTVGEVIECMKNEISTTPVDSKVIKQVEPTIASNSVDTGKAESAVLSILAEKTGYDLDMIENDMELETELGIDSIKRVEILSEVQDMLKIEAKDVDALSRTRTVGEVIEAMKIELASIGGVEHETQQDVETPQAQVSVIGSMNAAQTVLQVLAEKTGYEVDMIEDDMELETELGIDSIKRVEILSEVQDILKVEAKDVDALSRTRTVGEVIAAMNAELGNLTQVTDASEKSSVKPIVLESPSDALNEASDVVLQVLAEKTGYEVDMIEDDMELETELGIDSIKRVEILSEVQDLMGIEAKDVDALSRTRTVGEVINAMKAEMSQSDKAHHCSACNHTRVEEKEPSLQTNTSDMFAKAEAAVLNVLAEKTGYEVEMIELDMELETELGIDSIKRVEILSEVQEILSVEAADVDALSRTRTVGEVIAAMKKEIDGGHNTTSTIPTPELSSSVVGSVLADASSAEESVLKVLAEKTGYEVDMIELDMELETELGIDSIKRVEILSEVQELLKVEAKDVDALSRTRTVGEVIDALKKEMGGSLTESSTSSFVVVPSAESEAAEKVVFKVLAEKTGYEVDMIEEDMELETELGIDSIKRVEILSEVQDILGIEAKNVDALSRTRTVGEVIKALQDETASLSNSAGLSENKSQNDSFDAVSFDFNDNNIRDSGSENLNLSYPEIVRITPATREKKLSLGDIVICGDANLARSLQSALKVKVLSIPVVTEESEIEKLVGTLSKFECFVYVQNNQEPALAMLYLKHINKLLSGRKQVIVILQGDGQLGYSGNFDSVTDLEKYSLAGLMKTVALEWDDVKSKLIDVDVGSQIAPAVISELFDSNYMVKEVGYKDGKRYGVNIRGLRSEALNVPPSKEDVWLVTGGARGITPLCIRELAKVVQGGKYILVGRSKLEDIPSWAKKFESQSGILEKDVQKAAIQYIKSTGEKPKPAVVKVLVKKVFGSLEVRANMRDIGNYCNGNVSYVSCDINDKNSVNDMMSDFKKRGVEITGFFHASGVLRDKLLVQKKREDFDLVYNTKVKGFINIFERLDTAKLKHCTVFSSLAGFYGNAGQSDYSMANEVLNKISYFLSTKKVSCKAFDFGPWDGGMVSPALKKHFIENNVQIIDRLSGAITVAKIMLNSSKKQILVGNWGLKPRKSINSKNVVELVFEPTSHLSDHAIKGVTVLPFTYALSSVVTETLGMYPGYYLERIKTVELFRGIKLEGKGVKTRIECEEIPQGSGDNINLVVKLNQEVKFGIFAPSYKFELEISPKFHSITSLQREIPRNLGSSTVSKEIYDGETLFHGKTFQGISRFEYDDSKAVASVNLSESSFDNISMSPLILDTIYQIAVVHARKCTNYASLPSSLVETEFNSDLFNGSRSFKNLFFILEKKKESTDSTWFYGFSVQDNTVLCTGTISITLTSTLSYK